jgi:cytoskeleton-associated protein 5
MEYGKRIGLVALWEFYWLNLVTVPDTYPLLSMMDFASRLAGCSFFSEVDLRKGYHQIPVNPQDIPKMAIITPFDLFEYLRMPLGLRNAGSSFQRMMDRVLAGLVWVWTSVSGIWTMWWWPV